jgi:hypothetical protein
VICCSNVYKSIAEEISYNSPISKTRSNLQELSAWKVNDRLACTNDRIATGKKENNFYTEMPMRKIVFTPEKLD